MHICVFVLTEPQNNTNNSELKDEDVYVSHADCIMQHTSMAPHVQSEVHNNKTHTIIISVMLTFVVQHRLLAPADGQLGAPPATNWLTTVPLPGSRQMTPVLQFLPQCSRV
jgi:hypothetical protein